MNALEPRSVMGRLHKVGSVASPEDYQHIKTILTNGCPSKLVFDEPKNNTILMFERGNQNVVLDNPDLVNTIINKEDRYSHLVPLRQWVCRLGPHLQYKSQGIIDLKRLIWDKSTNISALDLVLNDLTPIMRRLRSYLVPLKVNLKRISTIREQIFHIQSFCLPWLT